MSDYTQTTFFAPKDALSPGDPDKLIVGAQFDTEFGNIQTANNTKYDAADLADQATAETGTDNTTLMTPLRTAQRGDAQDVLNAGIIADLRAQADPGADRIFFWDDSAGQAEMLTVGTNLTINDTTLNASGGGGGDMKIVEVDETRNNTGTVSDSTYLAGYALQSATKYLIRGVLMFTTSSTEEISYKLDYDGTTGGGGGGFIMTTHGYHGSSLSGGAEGGTITSIGSIQPLTNMNSATTASVTINASFETGSSGTLDFQWAQNIATAVDSKLKIGSWLEVVVIA